MKRFAAAASLILLALPVAVRAADEEEPEPKVKITDWSMDRARKDISGGTNLVRALMKIQNIGDERIENLSAKLVFYEAMGERLGATRPFVVREIKSGKTAPLVVQSIFVPIFGSYELHVDYRYGKARQKHKHRYMGASAFSPPELITDELLPKTAKVAVLGHDVQYDPRRRQALIRIRLKNLGEMKAEGTKVHLRFYSDKGKLIGRELSYPVSRGKGDPNAGTVKGGEEIKMSLPLRGVPKFKSMDVSASSPAIPAEKRLAGGEFKGVDEVEVAHFSFKRPQPVNLTVGAKVRNGLKIPVVSTVITFVFYAEKDVKLKDSRGRTYKEKRQVPFKKIPVAVPGRLEPGGVKEISFEAAGVAHFTNLNYEAAYQEPEKKTRTGMTAAQVGEVVVEGVSCVKKGKDVEVAADIVNRRKLAAKDIAITFEFRRTDAEGEEVTVHKVTHVIKGITRPGEVKPLKITVKDPPEFSSYFFNVSYSEGGSADK